MHLPVGFAYVTWVTCLNILLYRSVADKVAGAGFLVVAPDFFHGDAANPSNPKYDKDTWRKNHTTVSFLLQYWLDCRI